MKLETKKLSRWVAALAFAAMAPLAHAAPNLVINPGFENQVGSPFGFDNWTTTDGLGNVSSSTEPVHSGLLSARFPYDTIGAFDLVPTIIAQTPDLTLTSGTVYDVEFWLNFITLGDFSAKLDGQELITLLTGDTPGAGGWAKYHGQLTASGGPGTLAFSWSGSDPNCTSSANGRGDCSIFLDDVSVSAAQVPEPGTLLLVGAALAASAMVRRRKQSKG